MVSGERSAFSPFNSVVLYVFICILTFEDLDLLYYVLISALSII